MPITYMYAPSRVSFSVYATLVCVLLFGAVGKGFGQRVYADVQTNGITSGFGNSATVTNPGFSINTDYTDFTKLTASSTLGTATAWQQLIFSGNPMPANSTVYVRITSTNALLGGGIAAQAYANSTSVQNGNTVDTQSTFFTIPSGITYLAITGTSSFNAVRMTLSSPIALGMSSANIYYAFYDAPSQSCAEVLGTTTQLGGVTLGSITNPGLAIDDDLATFSHFSVVLGVLSSAKQTAYFSSLSNSGDAATVTFSVPDALLSLSLISNVTISAYKGDTYVSSTSLSSLLTLDLLGLFGNNGRVTVSYVPSGIFDRIEVNVDAAVGALTTLNVHEIQRTPAKPTVPNVFPASEAVCYGNSTILTATATSPGSILRWYNQPNGGTQLQEGSPYTTPPIMVAPGDTAFFYVAAAWNSGCPAESERTVVAVIANPIPSITLSTVAPICQEQITAVLPYSATTNSPTRYSIVWDGSPAGFANVPDASLTAVPAITLSIPANATAGSYSGVLKVKNGATGCESASIPFSIQIKHKPNAPTLNINPHSQY